MSKLKQIFLHVMSTAIVTGAIVFAGTLTPGGNTSTPTMVTLSDLYSKVLDNTYATSSHSISTSSSPGSSMETLEVIFNAIPTLDATKILTGTTYMGVEGSASAGAAALTWSSDHPSGYVDWDTAMAYCAGTVDGQTGWHLPYVEELMAETPLGNPDFTKIGGFQSDFYWSGVPHPNDGSYGAYVVVMYNGDALYNNKSGQNSLARCAR